MSAIKIVVMGVGGCGSNAVNYIHKQGDLTAVEMICTNTDLNHLEQMIEVENKLQLGPQSLGGLGTGGKVEKGQAAAEESIEQINAVIKDANMLFLIAGLGKGTGTGATPVIARAAKEQGILTVAFVVRPAPFQLARLGKIADEAVSELRSIVDSLIVVPNSLDSLGEDISVVDAYNYINHMFYKGVKGITDVITKTGHNNIDFNDMRSVMDKGGLTLICQSEPVAKENYEEVLKQALYNPFFKDIDIKQAKSVLVNIIYGEDFEWSKINHIMMELMALTEGNPNPVFGENIDPAMAGKVAITIVLTGMDSVIDSGESKQVNNPSARTSADPLHSNPNNMAGGENHQNPGHESVLDPVIHRKQPVRIQRNMNEVEANVSEVFMSSVIKPAMVEKGVRHRFESGDVEIAAVDVNAKRRQTPAGGGLFGDEDDGFSLGQKDAVIEMGEEVDVSDIFNKKKMR